MASVDVVGVRRPRGGGSTRDVYDLVDIGEGGRVDGEHPAGVVPLCANRIRVRGARRAISPRVSAHIAEARRCCVPDDLARRPYQARPVVGGLRPAEALGTLIGNQ
jgi:hypothetical protein